MARPNASEYAPYYHTYIGKVPKGTVHDLLETTFQYFQTFISKIPESKGDYAYADGKWSIKQVLQHLVDTERVMAYRALRIARGDKTPIPGFDQDVFARSANVSSRTLADLMQEFSLIRQSSQHLFQSFQDEEMSHLGTASDNPVSVRALAYIILGHTLHHQRILEERYL